MKRTIVYVDGFNFYYACLKHSRYKWLNLETLFNSLIDPEIHTITKIKYFTARIAARPSDPQGPNRQDAYFRALLTFPCIEIIYGSFQSRKKWAFCPDGSKVEIVHTEEKGSDVNLAVHMLNDAWLNEYDCALLVSNDSDMCESLRLIKNKKKLIGWVCFDKGLSCLRSRHHPSVHLSKLVDFRRFIKEKHLRNALLPSPIPGTSITKPDLW